MKRIIAFVSAILMMMGLVGCGYSSEFLNNEKDTSSQTMHYNESDPGLNNGDVETDDYFESKETDAEETVIVAEDISLDETDFWLGVGVTAHLFATIVPEGTTDKSVQWTSSNTSVATVDTNGNVTAVGGGEAIITAKTSNGKTATCHIVSVADNSLKEQTDTKSDVLTDDKDNASEKVYCPTCGGLGWVPNTCYSCGGLGMCSKCYGSGEIICNHCISGSCMECFGNGRSYNVRTGMFDICKYCYGSGSCKYCHGNNHQICTACGGMGICPVCHNDQMPVCPTCLGRCYVTSYEKPTKSNGDTDSSTKKNPNDTAENNDYSEKSVKQNEKEQKTSDPSSTIVDQGECGSEGDNVTWVKYGDGTLVISGKGEMRDYEKESGLPTLVNTVVIEDGVTNIGEKAFLWSHMTDVNIADSVTSIGDSAFEWCTELTDIQLPDNISRIGTYAFAHCSNLTSMVLPGNLKSIGEQAFRQSTAIKTITIPGSVNEIGNSAFLMWKSSQTIKIEGKNGASAGWDSKWNYSCEASVIWDKTVNTVVDQGECGDNGDNVIWTQYGNRTLVISGTGEMRDYEEKSGLPKSIDHVVIEDGVTYIGKNAFMWSTMKDITIADSVTSIGDSAFEWCSNLIEVTLPDSIVQIGDYAFALCSHLTAVTLSDSLEVIGEQAFRQSMEIKTITIPSSVKTIEKNAFLMWTKSQTIKIEGNKQRPSGWDSKWNYSCKASIIWDE